MREKLQFIEPHHRRRTLDSVHYTENLVNIIIRKGLRLLCFEQNLIKLFKKRVGFKNIHVNHGFHAGFNFRHFFHLSFRFKSN
jgi:hypothetical protein